MNINRISSAEIPVQKTLQTMQNYIYNPFSKDHQIKPELLAHDLYRVSEKCNTSQLKTLFNNTFVNIAQRMIEAQQNNFAGIIYSFLIKTNQENIPFLKTITTKALKCAQKQNDSVHIATRAAELANLYKDTEPDKYLTYMTMARNALKDVCENYDTIGKNFNTISRSLNTKEAYLFKLIRTDLDIVLKNEKANPKENKKRLLAIYKNINSLYEDPSIVDKRELCRIRTFAQKQISDLVFNMNYKGLNPKELKNVFDLSSEKVIHSVLNKEPITKEKFTDFYSGLYDEFKKNAQEKAFISKTFEFIDKLENVNGEFFTSKLYTILLDKNKSNFENTMMITRNGLNRKIKDKDDFGIVFSGFKLAKVLKENNEFGKYINTLDIKMTATKNIINNYEELSKTRTFRPKEDYIKELMYDKVSVANALKRTNPEHSKEVLKEAKALLDSLPNDYKAKDAAIGKIAKYIHFRLSHE